MTTETTEVPAPRDDGDRDPADRKRFTNRPHSTPSTPLDGALQALRRGWQIVPVRRADKAATMPWADGGLTAPEDAHQHLSSGEMNYAVLAKFSGLVVLDGDRAGELDRWAAHHALTLPSTYTVRTGREAGGEHRYFLAPAGAEVTGSTNLHGFAVDVRGTRGAGGYVVGAGSLHGKTGATYEVTDGRDPVQLPAEVLAALTPPKREQEHQETANGDGSSDPVPDLGRARAYVQAAVPGVLAELQALAALVPGELDPRGDGWDKAAFRLACRLVRLSNTAPADYPLERARQDFMEHGPTDRDFDQAALFHRWSSAARTVGGETVELHDQEPWQIELYDSRLTVPEPDTEEEPAGRGDGPLSRFSPLSWPKVLDGPPEPEDWLIWPLVERGKSVSLYSPAKAGKSLLVLELVAAAVAGRPALGRPGQEPIRVLYLDQENTASDLRERLAAMGVDAGDIEGLVYLSFPAIEPLTTARGGATLAALAAEYRPDLIVLDTVSRFIDGPENDSDTWHALELHSLRGLKRDEIGVLRLDHAGKDAERGERGSSAKNGDVDASWSLTHETRTGTRTLTRKITRNGHGPDSLLLSIEEDPLQHVPTGGTGEHPAEAAERLLDELQVPETGALNPAYERVKAVARENGSKPLPREAVRKAQERRQARGGDPA